VSVRLGSWRGVGGCQPDELDAVEFPCRYRLSGHQAQAASNGTESTVSRISFLTIISNPGSLHPVTLSSRSIRQDEDYLLAHDPNSMSRKGWKRAGLRRTCRRRPRCAGPLAMKSLTCLLSRLIQQLSSISSGATTGPISSGRPGRPSAVTRQPDAPRDRRPGYGRPNSALGTIVARAPVRAADARALLVHCAKEMQHLAQFLPALCAEFRLHDWTCGCPSALRPFSALPRPRS
jgi:hypothetical protein